MGRPALINAARPPPAVIEREMIVPSRTCLRWTLSGRAPRARLCENAELISFWCRYSNRPPHSHLCCFAWGLTRKTESGLRQPAARSGHGVGAGCIDVGASDRVDGRRRRTNLGLAVGGSRGLRGDITRWFQEKRFILLLVPPSNNHVKLESFSLTFAELAAAFAGL